MKNSNGIIGNRTRDLPACSAVPEPTEPPRANVINLRRKVKFSRIGHIGCCSQMNIDTMCTYVYDLFPSKISSNS
jgi:hypothetical protein